MQARKFDSLQVLRGFAASAVVYHHAIRAATVKRNPSIAIPDADPVAHLGFINLGAAGVDIFFILSGFLMVYISKPYLTGERTVGHFLAHRLIRIWPLYALTMGFLVFQKWRFMLRSGIDQLDLHPHRLLSFLFIPSFNRAGDLQPILGPGWTLNYEMFFYLCFAAALLLSRGRRLLAKLAAILCAAFGLGLLLPGTVPGAFLGDSIMFEFLFGAVLASAILAGRLKPTHGLVWSLVGLGLLALSIWRFDIDALRPIAVGLPAAMIFIGFIAFEGKVDWPAPLKLIGDASYSIYLTHILVVYPAVRHGLRLMLRLGMPELAVAVASVGSSLLAIAAGIVCYLLIERPLLRVCQDLYARFAKSARRAPVAP